MISPMLLHHAGKDFVLTDEWVLEIKYDGVRAIFDTTGREPILYTRKGVDITEQFPEISAPEGLILDGEIVGFNDKGFHKLNWVQRRLGVKGRHKILERMADFPIQFVAFDILNNLKDDYSKRRRDLDQAAEARIGGVIDAAYAWTPSPVYMPYHHDKLWNYIEVNNMEGLVAKKITSRYVPGIRSYNWRKIKHQPPKYRSTDESLPEKDS